jgi:AraC-like DNA-binding protein
MTVSRVQRPCYPKSEFAGTLSSNVPEATVTPDTLLAVTPPPPSAQRLESDDPDEVTSWVARRDGDHSRVVHGAGPYGFWLARIETPSVQLAWARTRLANTLRARFRVPTFHLALHGMQHYAFGRRQMAVATGGLVFMAPGTEVTRHSEGHPIMAIELDPSTFESEVQKRHGADRVDWPLVPQPLELSEPQRRGLLEAIAELVHAHEAGVVASSRIHSENRLVSALAGALPGPAASKVAPVSVQRLDYLEGWIDAHVGEVITLGRLCGVAQVGERSLQLAFQARRGMSPMRFVSERRLAAAHRRLSNAGAGEDVTAIATSLGFTHLGRFSIAYRAAFGESPSHTLLRGRRWAQWRSVAPPGQ